MKIFISIIIFFIFVVDIGYSQIHKIAIADTSNKNIDYSLKLEINHSIESGLKWLFSQQEKNGSWQMDPAITSLVTSAFLRYSNRFSDKDSFLSAGFGFLKNCVKADGGIYNENLPNYTTSISLMAFKDAGNIVEYGAIIKNAEKFLMGLQYDEEKGYTKDSLSYGGVDYGNGKSPDISNLQWAVEALQYKENNTIEIADASKKNKDLYYSKALTFLSKCQNLKSVNSESYSADDGGFMYSPGKSKAGESKSYGSMTYAGLKTMIYAKVDKNDKRVIGAYSWIKKNYSVETNPGMGEQGLYYYFHTFAKSLSVYGEDYISDSTGVKHNWRKELAENLIKIQNEEGWWQNQNGRWWENNKVLVTAYSILSLEEILK